MQLPSKVFIVSEKRVRTLAPLSLKALERHSLQKISRFNLGRLYIDRGCKVRSQKLLSKTIKGKQSRKQAYTKTIHSKRRFAWNSGRLEHLRHYKELKRASTTTSAARLINRSALTDFRPFLSFFRAECRARRRASETFGLTICCSSGTHARNN